MVRILEGDAREVLRRLAESSVDAIVTDPPYELGFMGKVWDKSGIAYSVPIWAEALRVLKPGGHLLAFGGSRTYHRLVCAIEDAGFEIRDQIMWIYGSGFPKSLDVSKAIDKAARGVPQGGADPTSANHGKFKGGCSEKNPSGRGFGAGPGQFMREKVKRVRFDGKPTRSSGGTFMSGCDVSIQSGPPITEAAKQWSGWGTALKPAHEPIVVARKPLVGTVAANVLQHGTGALNIDGCRVSGELPHHNYGRTSGERSFVGESSRPYNTPELGRWPANVIHDGSEEVVSCFPNAPGQCGAVRPDSGSGQKTDGIYGRFATNSDHDPRGDSGSAARFFYKVEPDSGDSGVSQLANQRVGEPSAERTYEERGGTSFTLKPGARRFDMGSPARFFYCAKADREERNRGCEELGKKPLLWSAGTQSPGTFQREGVDRSAQNNHPTVKPVALMAYLCRLVTPPGGTVLDCFMGSGSTGIAALREGFHFIGIEVNPAYAEIARRRIAGDAPLLNQATEKGETSDEDGAQAYSGGD